MKPRWRSLPAYERGMEELRWLIAANVVAHYSYRRAMRCFWCNRRFSKGEPFGPGGKSKDHLIPVSHGGAVPGNFGNVVAACRACNEKRANCINWRPQGWRHRQALETTKSVKGEPNGNQDL